MKKKLVAIIALLLIAFLGVIIFFFNKDNEVVNNNNEVITPKEIVVPNLEIKYMFEDVCKDNNDEKCSQKQAKYYRIDDYNHNEDLNGIIEQINTSFATRKEDIANGKYSFDECTTKKDIYKYRYIDQGYIEYFTNDDFSAIVQDLVSYDVCTEKMISPIFNIYYYDVKNQKLIEEKDLLQILNLKKSDVDNRLIDSLIANKIIKDQSEYNKLLSANKLQCSLYITMVGHLRAKCIHAEDNTFEDYQLYTYDELGLRIKFDE